MRGTVQSVRRRSTLGTAAAAVCGLSVALGIATTPATHAASSDCGDMTNTYWTPDCTRSPVDGDAGGVSGEVEMVRIIDGGITGRARIEFQALGEHLYLWNSSDEIFRVSVSADGDTEYNEYLYPGLNGEGVLIHKNLSFADNQDVTISIDETDENNTAWLSRLVS